MQCWLDQATADLRGEKTEIVSNNRIQMSNAIHIQEQVFWGKKHAVKSAPRLDERKQSVSYMGHISKVSWGHTTLVQHTHDCSTSNCHKH